MAPTELTSAPTPPAMVAPPTPHGRGRDRRPGKGDELTPGHLDIGEGGFVGSARWRSMVRWFVAALLVLVAGAFALNWYVDPMDLSGSGRYQPQVAEARNRMWKVELLAGLEQAPGVLVLGSSTARNVDPSEVGCHAGTSAFNASLTAGRTIDAYALASYVDDRFPRGRYPHLLWAVDVDGLFRDLPANPGLVTTPQLARQFSTAERVRLAGQVFRPYLTTQALQLSVTTLRTGVAQAPIPPARARFRVDGFRLRDPYARGGNAARRTRAGIDRYRTSIYTPREHAGRLGRDARRWFERTLAVANRRGDVPTIVLMPVHPDAVEALAPYGWHERHRALVRYLHGLRGRYRLNLVDLSDARDAGVEAGDFQDNVHLGQAAMNRMLGVLAGRGEFRSQDRRK